MSGESSQQVHAEEVYVKTKHKGLRRKKPFAIGISVIVITIALCGLVIANPFNDDEPNKDSSNQTPTGFHYSEELFYDEPDESHFTEDPDTGIDYINNEVVLYCEEGASASQALKSVGEADFELVGHIEAARSYQVRLAQDRSYDEISRLCQRISQTEGVTDCLPHYAVAAEPTDITRDPAWSEAADKGKPSRTWGLRSIKAPEAWSLVEADESVRVGVMEASQFYVYHEDLDSAIKDTLPKSDSQFDIKDESDKNKPDAHGTHVAGIIGAESNDAGSVGVAYGASLYGYSCGGKASDGNAKMTAGYGIEIGLTYLIDMCDCSVVNISVQWAGDVQKDASKSSGDDAAAAKWEMQQYGLALETYFKALIDGGHGDFLICKSADNDGDKGLANWDMLGCIQDSEVASRILVVGSLAEGKNGQLEVSSFSSCGSRVDVLAPGSDIYSTIYNVTGEGAASVPYSDYGYMSGTSMATPMVTGVAVLVKAANPSLKGDQIKAIVSETATGSYRDKTGVSRGQVDAESAVKKAIDTKPLVVYLDGETTDERYSAYLEKVEELQSKYGVGKVDTLNNGSLKQMRGLCLVDLIDFDDDGDEELLLGYYDEPQTNDYASGSYASAQAYRAEVWGYEDDGINMLYESNFQWTNGGFAYLPVYHRSNDVAMYTVEYGTDADNRSVGTYGIWILKGDAFEEITTFSAYGLWGTGEIEYEVDGEKVDASIYETYFDDTMGDYTATSYWMTWNEGSSFEADRRDTLNTPADTLAITKDTIEKLGGKTANDDSQQSDNAGVFADKINELVGKYGEPSVATYTDKHPDGDASYTYSGVTVQAEGLCYAKLMDFDKDGNDELLTICYDPTYPNNAGCKHEQMGPEENMYRIDVWCSADEGLVQLCSHNLVPFEAGVGAYLYETDAYCALQTCSYATRDNAEEFGLLTFENDLAKDLTEWGRRGAYYATNASYFIDGATVGESAYRSYPMDFLGSYRFTLVEPIVSRGEQTADTSLGLFASAASYKVLGPEQAVEVAKSTISEIELSAE